MIGSIALLLLLFGVVLHAAIRRTLVREFDSSLTDAAHAIAVSVEIDDDEIEIEFDPARVPKLQDTELPFYFQFRLPDGTTLMRSKSLGSAELPQFYGTDGKPVIRPLALDNGKRLRALGVRFVPAVDSDYFVGQGRGGADGQEAPLITLVVARSTERLEERLAAFRWLLLGVGALTMTAALAVSLLIVGRGLRPLHLLAGRIAAIREEELSVRIPGERMPDEMLPVVERLNDLLRRLEEAFKRERAFSADVAHELRTPLTGLRTTIEVALSRERQAGEYTEALQDSLEIVERMNSMVENLLMIARLEAGRTTLRRDTVHLSAVVDACWEPLSSNVGSRGQSFDNRIPADLTCAAEPDSMVMVFTNLLENATEYGGEGGKIWATGSHADGCMEVTIANTGCTLTAEQVSQVFDPFWRADPARKDVGRHCGLGLALVRRVVCCLGGDVSAEVDPDGVFRVRAVLPQRDQA